MSGAWLVSGGRGMCVERRTLPSRLIACRVPLYPIVLGACPIKTPHQSGITDAQGIPRELTCKDKGKNVVSRGGQGVRKLCASLDCKTQDCSKCSAAHRDPTQGPY